LSRVITSPGGGRYVERSLGGSVVERRWLVPEDEFRPGPRPVRAQPVPSSSVEFREHVFPRYVVELAGETAEAIEREVFDTHARFGSFAEQGGYLFRFDGRGRARWLCVTPAPVSGLVLSTRTARCSFPSSRTWSQDSATRCAAPGSCVWATGIRTLRVRVLQEPTWTVEGSSERSGRFRLLLADRHSRT
jgi:hypothetical protein